MALLAYNCLQINSENSLPVFHWYDYLDVIFIPSLGSTDVMLQVDALTKFTQQGLQDCQKAI